MHWFVDPDEFRAAAQPAFAEPDVPAVPQGEALAGTRDRLVPAARRVLDAHPGQDAVLVGHRTARTLVWELTGRPPDLDGWAALRRVDAPAHGCSRRWSRVRHWHEP